MTVLRGKLVVAQSGGPTPVFNNSACGVIQEALQHDDVFDGVYGASNGIMGILHEDLIDLRQEAPATIEGLRRTPASTIGSCRKKLDQTDMERILSVLKAHNIRYFFYNGGNDSMDTANKVHQMATAAGYEMRVFGIPKTVDNDLVETDHCPGFGSAARFMALATRDVGRDTESNALTTTPICVMEAMGRDAGWLTGATAVGRRDERDAPHLIYLPEIPFTLEKLFRDVQNVYDRLGFVVIAASEGIRNPDGELLAKSSVMDAFGHAQLGGVGDFLAKQISANLKIKARANIAGTIQRAMISTASQLDLNEAYLVGQMGVKYALEGHSGDMVALVRTSNVPYVCTTGLAPLDKVANAAKSIPRDMINAAGNDVNDAFLNYVTPLLGELPLDYIRFERHGVGKLLTLYRR